MVQKCFKNLQINFTKPQSNPEWFKKVQNKLHNTQPYCQNNVKITILPELLTINIAQKRPPKRSQKSSKTFENCSSFLYWVSMISIMIFWKISSSVPWWGTFFWSCTWNKYFQIFSVFCQFCKFQHWFPGSKGFDSLCKLFFWDFWTIFELHPGQFWPLIGCSNLPLFHCFYKFSFR